MNMLALLSSLALLALGVFSIPESQSALSEVVLSTAGNVEGNMEVMLVCFLGGVAFMGQLGRY